MNSKVHQNSTIPKETDELVAELRTWWNQERMDWDALVAGEDNNQLPAGLDIWDDMPELDSKAVARTSPIFERYLGIPLNVKLIRPGGYQSMEDMITDLVPKMAQVAMEKSGRNNRKERS